MSPVQDRGARAREFGAALRQSREDKGLSQQALASALANAGFSRTYQSVQGWERGEGAPEPEIVFALEECLDVPPGRLSRVLGYLPAGAVQALTVPEALAADHRLSEPLRVALLAAYNASVES